MKHKTRNARAPKSEKKEEKLNVQINLKKTPKGEKAGEQRSPAGRARKPLQK